jgi:hypothetical protein
VGQTTTFWCPKSAPFSSPTLQTPVDYSSSFGLARLLGPILYLCIMVHAIFI